MASRQEGSWVFGSGSRVSGGEDGGRDEEEGKQGMPSGSSDHFGRGRGDFSLVLESTRHSRQGLRSRVCVDCLQNPVRML